MRKLRHELKYYIRYTDYLILRKRLALLLKADRHHVSEEGYRITSLYFDNAEGTDIYDKVNGIKNRKKFRIRIYNENAGTINLEKKSRYGDIVEKTTATINMDIYHELLSGNFSILGEMEDPSAKDFYLLSRSQLMRPAVIVDYIREAYVDPFHDIRITFDKQLKSVWNTHDLFDEHAVGREVLQDGVIIMEVKYRQFWPESLRSLLQFGSYERQAISKYVLCREERIRQFKE